MPTLLGSTRVRRWGLGALLIAAGLAGASALLDAGIGIRPGLRYEIYQPGEGLGDTPLAKGIVALPSIRGGDGISSQDENRLIRGAGQRSVRWTGLWYVPDSGTYEIFLSGTGTLVVRIDGVRVVRNPGTSVAATTGLVELDEGFHRLLVTFRRSRQMPQVSVHWAPEGERPRPFDRNTLLPQRTSVERYVWFQWLLVLRRLSLGAGAIAALLLLGPVVVAAVRRPAARLRACSNGVTIAALVGATVFVITTLFHREIVRIVGRSRSGLFSLAGENNLAAWWSGALLLLAALYAVEAASRAHATLVAAARDAKVPPRAGLRSIRAGWISIAIVLAALSADELGQFHEWMDLILGWGTWLSLLPFALALLGVASAGFVALWRLPPLRGTVVALVAGFAILGTVPPALEFAEHTRDWGIPTTWSHPYNLRLVLEEGSELLGMLVLLHACAWGRLIGPAGRERFPATSIVPDPMALRRPLLIVGWVVALGVTLLSLLLPPAMSPQTWFVTAFFLVAATTSLARHPAAAGSRLIATIALFGSVAGTVFKLWGPVWLGVAVALALAWHYIRRHRPLARGWWLPVLSVTSGLLMFTNNWPGDSALRPLLPQLLGLVALALTAPPPPHTADRACQPVVRTR